MKRWVHSGFRATGIRHAGDALSTSAKACRRHGYFANLRRRVYQFFDDIGNAAQTRHPLFEAASCLRYVHRERTEG